MIVQGLKLAVLGMGVVFCFLLLLMVFIQISAKVLTPRSQAKEGDMSETKKRRKKF
ncbi:MAG: OadG family protein [Desulfotignum sp.]|nr:OadG family protein [Desulfotignum sp.]